MGHREGAKTFEKIVTRCREIGIPYISFFAFSTENWKRPQEEVDAIMRLFDQYLDELRKHADENVKIIFPGDKGVFTPSLKSKMLSLENDSSHHTGMTLLLAMNYGGRADIIHAARQAAVRVQSGALQPSQITEELFASYLYTFPAPDVDLIIRPSGEKRLSNFMAWQSVYAEYYFSDVLWPDFTSRELEKALEYYAARDRRFGGI